MRVSDGPTCAGICGRFDGNGRDKGSFYHKGALQFASMQHAIKLVLVDGDQLARLMVAHNVGVSVRHTYEIKGIDRDYFDIGD